jgi:hypothetical protein
MSKSYRPSNGTEGDAFMGRWCGSCQRNAAYDDGCGGAGCEIAVRALAFNEDDPEYPAEWAMRDGEPVCTAWQPISDEAGIIDEVGIIPDARQADMFAEAGDA